MTLKLKEGVGSTCFVTVPGQIQFHSWDHYLVFDYQLHPFTDTLLIVPKQRKLGTRYIYQTKDSNISTTPIEDQIVISLVHPLTITSSQ